MVALYILNILTYILMPLLCPLYFTRYFKLGWINLLIIPLVIALPIALLTSLTGPIFFLEDGLFNIYFQYALLVDNVHSLLGALTLIYIVRWFCRNRAGIRLIERLSDIGTTIKPERMRLAALIFLGVFGVSFVLLAQPTYGIVNWILSPRTGYQLYRSGAGQWYALSILSLSISIMLGTTYARSTRSAIAMAPVYLFCSYLLGSKGLILTFAASLVIVLAIRQFKYFAPMAIVLLLASIVLAGYNFATTMGGSGIQEIASYSDYYVNAAHYYESHLNGELPLYYGEITASNLWGVVPRALYPNKPYVYGIIKVIEVFYPGAAEATNTPAFATVEYYADFGWVGVVLSGFFGPANLMTAILYALILPRLNRFNIHNGIAHSAVLLYAYLLLVAPAFMMFFGFPLNLIMFYITMKIIDVVNRVRIVRVTAPPAVLNQQRLFQSDRSQ